MCPGMETADGQTELYSENLLEGSKAEEGQERNGRIASKVTWKGQESSWASGPEWHATESFGVRRSRP